MTPKYFKEELFEDFLLNRKVNCSKTLRNRQQTTT